MKTILAVTAASALMAALTIEASALSAPRLIVQDEATIATPVRDGCGDRRHWSPRFRRCVWNWRGW